MKGSKVSFKKPQQQLPLQIQPLRTKLDVIVSSWFPWGCCHHFKIFKIVMQPTFGWFCSPPPTCPFQVPKQQPGVMIPTDMVLYSSLKASKKEPEEIEIWPVESTRSGRPLQGRCPWSICTRTCPEEHAVETPSGLSPEQPGVGASPPELLSAPPPPILRQLSTRSGLGSQTNLTGPLKC